ncbi:GntR family transcriptional regulator [Pseudonocardia kunmingensis]|uniref:GntR family transcriptional regulator n=1 Tax=Pseudonocardia kunmingensis TaxID=630975 RepID=A0A543DVF0_9PSEU|nr:GntR family transcriptional regulator [Pseudonocardia kunmingensis]TQM13304.1 GntR family transcriptional regulator [Pseudonocardia kunmingensis]
MKALVPIEPVQLGDRAFDSLRMAIITGELAPGEPLRDRQLAAVLGVSRTPVREALHRLEAAGLTVSRGRAGWVVSPFTEDDVHELFQVRVLLEPVGIDELAEDPDEKAIAEIEHFFDGYERPIPPARTSDYFLRDNAFHTRIVGCSRNKRIRDMYAVVESHIERGRYLAAEGRADETLDEHLAIAHAIARRDFATARTLLVEHLRSGEQLMLERIRDHR